LTNGYLNGTYYPLGEIRISVLNKGYVSGDGVYDVVPVCSRRLFRLDQHIERLERSMAAIGVRNSVRGAVGAELLEDLVNRNGDVAARSDGLPDELSGESFLLQCSRFDKDVAGADECYHPGRPPLAALRHQDHGATRRRAAALGGA
jgi:branched-subunit amino acid aminotransferase/4-amino-4-deoxychorismate lyase